MEKSSTLHVLEWSSQNNNNDLFVHEGVSFSEIVNRVLYSDESICTSAANLVPLVWQALLIHFPIFDADWKFQWRMTL